jgi:MYXO-CTERM domain-containing protein
MVGLALGATASPRPAEACGGTFCDSGPQPMPVEQTGETIVFVLDGAEIEVHIQIQYDPTTEAEQFAWLVPVTALPEFSVGSQQLFANLLAGTVPSYGLGNFFEPCDDSFGDGFGGDGCDEGSPGSGFGDEGGDKLDIGGGEPPPPEVVLATTVGAFEVFVLDGGSVEGVMQWLGDNGFQQDPAAEPILEEYLKEGLLFVAFRLATDAEASEIHPITLRMPTTEPCVPIRLTRIAAQEDMDIRAFFLADGRVSSLNWRHVTLNPLKIDWMGLGANYREVVTMAVDEAGADGHAWVTEYAGPTLDRVTTEDLVGFGWDAVPFETATVEDAVSLLLDQGLYGYSNDTGLCEPLHPLVGGLVARYMTTPPDFPLEILCEDPSGFAAAVDPLAWDGPAFAADFQARVIDPAVHAVELLETWPYLTRLYTTISPGEMTEDPMFHPTPGLPDETGLTRSGTVNQFCDGAFSFSLPDSRLVALLDTATWPSIAPEEMPWVETIEYLPADGAPVIEVDHRMAIQGLLDAWNAENGPPRSPALGSCHGADESGGGNDSSGSGPGAVDDGFGKGCGCRGAGGNEPIWALLTALGAVGLRRRRTGC